MIKMNLIKYIVFFLFTIGTQKIFAQKDSIRNNETLFNKHKWEIAIDLLPLINKSNGNNIWLKYNYKNKRDLNRAWRLRFIPDFLNSGPKGVSSGPPAVFISFSPGHEWQKRSGKFVLFYGVDLNYSYSYSLRSVIVGVGSSPGSVKTEEKNRNTSIGLGSFIGTKYHISERFSASIESQLIYTYSDIYEERIRNGNTDFLLNSFAHQTQYKPIYVINFSYHF